MRVFLVFVAAPGLAADFFAGEKGVRIMLQKLDDFHFGFGHNAAIINPEAVGEKEILEMKRPLPSFRSRADWSKTNREQFVKYDYFANSTLVAVNCSLPSTSLTVPVAVIFLDSSQTFL